MSNILSFIIFGPTSQSDLNRNSHFNQTFMQHFIVSSSIHIKCLMCIEEEINATFLPHLVKVNNHCHLN